MSEPIKVSDMVQVVRTAECGCESALGHIFTVTVIRQSRQGFSCRHCGVPRPPTIVVEGHPSGHTVQLARLKRIPPMSELGDVEHKEEQPA